MPRPLSITLICCNNEDLLPRLLASVRPLEPAEIIAVDSGSTDRTLDLLRDAGARCISHPFTGFVEQKQRALDHAAQPWALHLDSDESLLPAAADAVARTVDDDDPTLAGCLLNRRTFYAGRPLDHAYQPEPRLRLVRPAHTRWTGLDPHDRLDLTPEAAAAGLRTELIPGDIRHDSITTIADFLAKQARHGHTHARAHLQLYPETPPASPLKLLTSPAGAFLKQLLLKRAFRDGWRGWVAAAAAATAALAKHAALLEQTNLAREARRDKHPPHPDPDPAPEPQDHTSAP